MTSRTRWAEKRFRALGSLAVLAAVSLSMSVPAAAQDSPSLIRDTEIEEILLKDSTPIFQAAGLDPKSVHILLVGSKDLQAFAAPGTMGIYTGLIRQSENPNQLRGVIAHEVGHLQAGHSFRSGDMMRAGLKPMILTMGLGVLAALAGAPDAGAILLGNASY